MLDVEAARASGKYPVVSLELFDKVYDLKFSDYILEKEEKIINMYERYIKDLSSMKPQARKKFLRTVKNREIHDNQMVDEKDTFFVDLHGDDTKNNAIDVLLKERHKNLSKKKFIEGHKVLLDGDFNKRFKNYYCRTDNSCYVGYKEKGTIKYHFFPLDYKDIDKATDEFLGFYNKSIYDDHLLLKPQIIHGLIATSQLFSDGNTRYSRVLQNVKLYDLSDRAFPYKLENPAVYGSRVYMAFRYEYRKAIKNIAKYNNDRAWNEWFDFNMRRLSDSIFFLDDKKDQYQKMLKK